MVTTRPHAQDHISVDINRVGVIGDLFLGPEQRAAVAGDGDHVHPRLALNNQRRWRRHRQAGCSETRGRRQVLAGFFNQLQGLWVVMGP